jgi:RND family efflux transporter MFP subunit
VAIAALSVVACGGQAAADSQQQSLTPEVGRIINVEVTESQAAGFIEVINVTGSVQANRDVTVSAEEGGVIREIVVDKGSRVRAGDPIARIDDRLLSAQVAQARAQSDLADAVWDRRRKLFENDKVGTEMSYLEAKFGAEQARASHELLAERLRRTTITAPISGLLDSREIEVGAMVAPGSPVARIIQLDTVRISGGVPERYSLDISEGTAVRVTFDVMRGRQFVGHITYAGAMVNARNRTFPIELKIANPGLSIKPEMVANIEATRRTLASTFSVPQGSLIRVEDGFVVFVVRKDSSGVERAVATPVITGPAQRNRVSIESGIGAGDRVIVVGQQLVANGDRVRVVNPGASRPPPASDSNAGGRQ